MLHRDVRIESISVEDVRIRNRMMGSGSDAANPHTDYSNPYVVIRTSHDAFQGHGIGFTLGRGNDMVCQAVRELAPMLEGTELSDVLDNMHTYWRTLANPLQARWIGPGSGPYYMAAGALLNAVFDLWAKLEEQPLWKALSQLEPERIVAMLDTRYVEHLMTHVEAMAVLHDGRDGAEERMAELEEKGLPCYFTTWIGTGVRELVEQVRRVREQTGIDAFKVKVGSSLEHDRERLAALREAFGADIELMTDSNQVWSVPQAIEWMQSLAEYDITWIEEPTAPDLVDGHRAIRHALAGYGIEVVSGENCPNSHLAAQLIAGQAVDRFQVDACRVLGPPENMLIMLAARKYRVPVCPHAGGSGLDELVPHLSGWNYVACAPDLDRVRVEHVGFCGEHFLHPSVVENGRLRMPTEPGYLVGMKDASRSHYAFPNGPGWK